MELKWVQHKGKKVLLCDYRGAKGEDESIKFLYDIIEIERQAPEKILELINVEGTFATQKYMDEAKRLGKEVSAKKVEKTALLGVSGVKKVLLRAYVLFTGDKMVAFNTEEEAKDWLVE